MQTQGLILHQLVHVLIHRFVPKEWKKSSLCIFPTYTNVCLCTTDTGVYMRVHICIHRETKERCLCDMHF